MLQATAISLTILLLALPIVSAVRLVVRKKHGLARWALWTLFISVACYTLLMVSVRLTEAHLEHELAKHDLDGDGGFSGAELTPEVENAMDAVTNDAGRTLAPFTGLVTCPLYSVFWHVIIGTPYLLFRIIKSTPSRDHATKPESPPDARSRVS